MLDKDNLVVIVNGEPQEVTEEVIEKITAEMEVANIDAMRVRQETIPLLRQNAYQSEADPLFFKMQRGEATSQDWLAKIDEIKQRYPK